MKKNLISLIFLTICYLFIGCSDDQFTNSNNKNGNPSLGSRTSDCEYQIKFNIQPCYNCDGSEIYSFHVNSQIFTNLNSSENTWYDIDLLYGSDQIQVNHFIRSGSSNYKNGAIIKVELKKATISGTPTCTNDPDEYRIWEFAYLNCRVCQLITTPTGHLNFVYLNFTLDTNCQFTNPTTCLAILSECAYPCDGYPD